MPRGRPKIYEKCTPELAKKHAMSLTKDPIDLCLEYGFINEEQHQYGLRFRWLHKVRFGRQMTQSQVVDASKQKSYYHYHSFYTTTARDLDLHDEYNELIIYLEKEKFLKISQDICIYSHMPLMVALKLRGNIASSKMTSQILLNATYELSNIQQAMKSLCDFYHNHACNQKDQINAH